MNSSSHLPLFSILLVMLGLTVSQSTNSTGAHSSTFTIVNNCNYTVWPAVASDMGSNCGNDSSGTFSCLTGDCGTSILECSGGDATAPVTLAEFKLGPDWTLVYYDVSLVDGYNLPLMISPHNETGGNCNSTGCAADLNGDCPSELEVVSGSETVACKSACTAFGAPQYCCDTTDTCNPTSTHDSSRVSVLLLIATPKMMQTVPSVVLLLIMTSLSAHPLPPGLMEVQRKEWRIKQVATSAMLPVEPAVPTATIEQSATVPLDFTIRQSSNNVSA
ncbi:hypothetical protein Gorai_019004 [Gossypium raimondii]|uniref:Thaumatin-like protein n=1 Tax=Gossypium raimondii TaxID=29730 RepID=A0A7J8PLX4_GOSRA|nr:hypothetical protein [Gossypium raimondii]